MSIPTSLAVESSSIESPQPCRRLTFSEIQVATQNFDESLVVGHGGFGKVYKGTITYGESLLTVAIKRLDSTSNQGAEEFWAEVEMLSKLRHCHLVSLIGYCNDVQEFILVYEYIPRGTLANHLHKGRAPLTWVQKLRICVGAARGLDYLHTGTGIKQGVIHRDVKSSNILLDRNWAAKISDFGLSKVGPINQASTYVNTMVKGTFGYIDPHYFETGRLTRKSDVYAFGVVLFEVLCGKEAVVETLDDEARGLASWAQDSIKEGRLKHIVDPNIRETISPKCLKVFAQLANQCLHDHPKKRPTMAEVVVGLESILARQEKTDNTLLPTDKKIFGRKALEFLTPPNRENSVGGERLKSLDMQLYTVGGEERILRRFDFNTIVDATGNFSPANEILLDLKYGIYKGRLQNGQHITIVLYKLSIYSAYEECVNEASTLVKLKHENLLPLLGYCIKGTNVYLLYDFAPYATLHDLIFDHNRAPLDWNARYKIILGVARVLVYLHKHATVRIIHQNVNHWNILLNESLEPKLFDFRISLSKAFNETDDIEIETARGAHWDYIAPEVYMGYLSTMADVYSFGVLVLVTISGLKTRDYAKLHSELLVEYAWRNWIEGTSSNIIDPRIIVDDDLASITKLIHIGLLCVQYEETDRPTMKEVVSMMLGSSSEPLPAPDGPPE